MGVAQMLAVMDSHELAEWIAFYKLEGEDRKAKDLAAKAEANLNKRRR